MTKLILKELRPKLDLETKYVDFSVLRTALSVAIVAGDLETNLSEATKDGECRGKCPKCRKDRSFALNINTNRFHCFAKGCVLKGGGVIDLIAKLYEVPAKEASHILACAYGIQPYSREPVKESAEENQKSQQQPPEEVISAIPESPQENREVALVNRAEFEALQNKVERLSMIVWSQLFENGEIDEPAELFDEQPDYEFESALSR
jgi:hypothetical protein